MNQLGLVLFTSTKGHFGRKDIYDISLQKLEDQCGGALENVFSNRFAHIKISPGEEDIGKNIRDNLESNWGFEVKSTIGGWEHDSISHWDGYTGDILKAFSDDCVHKCEFSLFFEDDSPPKSRDFPAATQMAMAALKRYKDKVSVMFYRGKDLPDREDAYGKLDGFNRIFFQKQNFTEWGPTFPFQPTVVRTRDIYQAYRVITQNYEKLKHLHIELISGMGMKTLTSDPEPFLFVDPEFCHSLHIGTPEFIEKLETEKQHK